MIGKVPRRALAPLEFARDDMDMKRAIFACLDSNLVIADQKVAITLRPVFKNIFETIPQVEREIAKIRTYPELAKTHSINGQSALAASGLSTMRYCLDEILTFFANNPDE